MSDNDAIENFRLVTRIQELQRELANDEEAYEKLKSQLATSEEARKKAEAEVLRLKQINQGLTTNVNRFREEAEAAEQLVKEYQVRNNTQLETLIQVTAKLQTAEQRINESQEQEHVVRRMMRRLAELLDEDQFAENGRNSKQRRNIPTAYPTITGRTATRERRTESAQCDVEAGACGVDERIRTISPYVSQ